MTVEVRYVSIRSVAFGCVKTRQEKGGKLMKIFSWKNTGYKADAQLVGEELEQIEMEGTLDAERVVEFAKRNKKSELHKCFEWDDEKASKNWRLYEARKILCSISIEIKEEPKKVQRVYVNIKDKDTEERTFKNINEVLKNDEEYQQLIDKAKREFEGCKDRYDDLLQKEDLKDIIFEIYREI